MAATTITQITGYGAPTLEDGKKIQLSQLKYDPVPSGNLPEGYIGVKIDTCGVCASDLHTITQGWPMPFRAPIVVGHEIVGTVVESADPNLKVGQRVGVGAQSGSCQKCSLCQEKEEPYCTGMVGTYQGSYDVAPDTHTKGGYADFVRVQGRFAIPVPESLPSEEASPLLCAGVTVYSPLKRFGAGPGKKVGVVGIGGLGHLALQISNAMGAETYAISHSDSKKALVETLGVKGDNFIATKNAEAEVAQKYSRFFDIVLVTATGFAPPLESLYFPITKPKGSVVLCGVPDEAMHEMHGFHLIGKGLVLAGSLIGGTDELREVLDLAAKGGIKPLVEVRPMKEAQQALLDLQAGKPQFRYVLKN